MGKRSGNGPRKNGMATAGDGLAIRAEKSFDLQGFARSGVSQSEENL
jgi:hypothetical protein